MRQGAGGREAAAAGQRGPGALAAAVLVALAGFAPVGAACVIDVRVANWWEEEHGAVQKARLEGTVLKARRNAIVKAWVRTKLRYGRSDGRAGTLRSLDRLWINTAHTTTGSALVSERAGLCNEDRPCWLNDVEVYDVDCFD